MVTRNNQIDSWFQNNSTGFTIGGGTITPIDVTFTGNANWTFSSPNNVGGPFILPNVPGDRLVGESYWTAKGSLITSTSSNATSELLATTNGFVLTLDSSQPNGMKWAAPGVPSWTEEIINFNIVPGGQYSTNAVGLITATLPNAASKYDEFQLMNVGAGGFRIAQLAGQQIIDGNQSTTVGVAGHIDSTTTQDFIRCVCVDATANANKWQVLTSRGNLNIF